MFRPNTRPAVRRGNTLIVTLLLLALLTVLGLAALYNARDLAQQTQIRAQTTETFADDGTVAFNTFLSSWIYDVDDSGEGLLNSVRGHSLMATMYGRQTGATIPWNGVGSFEEQVTLTTSLGASETILRPFLVNHAVQVDAQMEWYDPGYTGKRPRGGPITGTYIAKNAPYTYPDMKDFYLASQCPATGEILLPSFFRPTSQFPNLGPNARWTNGLAIVESVRPSQAIHPNFPPVPPNPDGTYTGDVQCLPGAFGPNGYQKNDSIWMDIGLPAITLPGGKRVKPLVAPLILDLDGRLNLSAHGNSPSGGQHVSGPGLGPWEVNLEKSLGLEGRSLAQNRGMPQTPAGISQKAFYERYPANTQLPQYSSVPWAGNGGAAATSLNMPGAGGNSFFANSPAYGGGYDNTNLATNFPNHPSLFNPTEWPTSNSTPRAYKLADNKFLTGKYAAAPSFHALLDPLGVGGFAPTTLRGPAAAATSTPPQGYTNPHRTDPSHANRQLFTTHSFGLDRIGLTNGQTQETLAAIGAVDLNRKLADYRDNIALPLDPGNMALASTTVGSAVVRQAEADRQAFAHDIFARLLVAVGPTTFGVTVDAAGNITIPAVTDQLRQIAQVAVNIVDYIDNDDVSTPFIWNPANPADPFAGFATFTTTDLSNRVVFGTEKPRLVINEAYSEIVNDPDDRQDGEIILGVQQPLPAGSFAHVRFWVELLNPTTTPYLGTGTANNPLGTGAAQLRYAGAGYSPYRIEIARGLTNAGAVNASVLTYLANAGNVTGGFNPGYTPEVRFVFDAAAVNAVAKQTVAPIGVAYNPSGNPAAGMIVVGPSMADPAVANSPKTDEFYPANPTRAMPAVPAAWYGNMIQSAAPTGPSNQNSLGYRETIPATVANANRVDYKRHVILLRRLANPYVAPNDPADATYNNTIPPNPFITVDYMDWVPAFDAIHRVANQPASRGSGGANGYTPIANRYAIGKAQPYAGLSVGTIAAMTVDPTYTFPNSMVLGQIAVAAGQPKNTFGRHNGFQGTDTYSTAVNNPLPGNAAETIMAPFDWLVHLDRPLINQAELLHVTAGKPHQLTQDFVRGPASKHTASVQNLLSNPLYGQLYRGLDLLRVQPYGQMTGLGGRVPGRININTIQDKRVWNALFDWQNTNAYTQTDVDNWWNALIASRTRIMLSRTDALNPGVAHPCPVPGQTIYDTNSVNDTSGNPADRPFLPFGVSTVPAGGGGYASNAGSGIEDTLLRGPLSLMVPPSATVTHPYQNAEGLRKILNNTTTVSHTFAVFVTVGYFEVVNEVPSATITLPNGSPAKFTQLGKEYYKDVPGDTRHKFFAVVDRSRVGLTPGTNQHATAHPFFTTVEDNAAVGATTIPVAVSGNGFVNADGTSVFFQNNMPLVVGVGATQEIVTVSGWTAPVNGVSTLTVSALTRPHYAGESVSNVMPGNPGPQPNFDVNIDMYRPVVPYWSRLP